MHNYSTNIVYLGIDVHKRTYSITAVIDNRIVKKTSMPADKQALLSFILKHFPNCQIYSAYEAGFSGYGLHRFLQMNRVNNIVVHPASIEVVPKVRSKTDKRDSQKIAIQLAVGRLSCVNIPSIQRESWRSITRLRAQIIQERTRVACRLKSFLHYFDLLCWKHKGKANRKWMKGLTEQFKGDNDIEYCIKYYVKSWLDLDNALKLINKRLQEQAKRDISIDEIYRRQPGIGKTVARFLANELDDMSQFKSESALFSFIGLTPSEHSSGDHRWLGHISRQGNPMIRSLLTEAAWKAIKKDAKLEAFFDRLVRNTGSRKKAILGVARKLIGYIRAEFKREKLYMEERLNKGTDLCLR
jgi:transposase